MANELKVKAKFDLKRIYWHENPEIKKQRDLLHSYYDKWKTLKKASLNHLPREPWVDSIEKVKLKLSEEIDLVTQIGSCCESLRDELNKDKEEK